MTKRSASHGYEKGLFDKGPTDRRCHHQLTHLYMTTQSINELGIWLFVFMWFLLCWRLVPPFGEQGTCITPGSEHRCPSFCVLSMNEFDTRLPCAPVACICLRAERTLPQPIESAHRSWVQPITGSFRSELLGIHRLDASFGSSTGANLSFLVSYLFFLDYLCWVSCGFYDLFCWILLFAVLIEFGII